MIHFALSFVFNFKRKNKLIKMQINLNSVQKALNLTRPNGSPLQYSGLGSPMDRGAHMQATMHGVAGVGHD